MKRLSISVLSALCLLSVGAREISESEALANVRQFVAGSSHSRLKSAAKNLQLRFTQTYTNSVSGETGKALYVFTPQNEEGFVIASADDCFPAVLGYGDSKFDCENMPEPVQMWLEGYANQVSMANTVGCKPLPSDGAMREAIAPLVTAQWGQHDPYNNKCPKMTTTVDGYTSAYYRAGCVAISMSQMMRHSPYRPAKSQGGTKSYTSSGVNTYTKAVSTTFGTEYDWNNMLDSYVEGEYTEAQKNAVAQFVFDCAVSMEMKFMTTGSSAISRKIPYALINYFGYDKSTYHTLRAFYTETEWIELLYNELSSGRPVIYNGTKSATGGGHSFVFDGYDSSLGGNYFHINWGWYGDADGYFLLDNLAPEREGAGSAGAVGDPYDISQGAVVNTIGNISGGYSRLISLLAKWSLPSSSLLTTSTTSQTLFTSTSSTYQTTPIYLCSGAESVTVALGYEVENVKTGDITYQTSSSSNTFKLSSYSSMDGLKVTPKVLCSGLSAGTYRVRPVFKVSGSSTWNPVLFDVSNGSYFVMTISGNNVNFSKEIIESEVIAEEPQVKTKLYSGYRFQYTATVKNAKSVLYDGMLRLCFTKSSREAVASADGEMKAVEPDYAESKYYADNFQVVLREGEEEIVDVYATLDGAMTAGTYTVTLVDESGNEINGSAFTAVVSEDPGELKYSANNDVVNKKAASRNKFTFTVDLAVENGYWDNPIYYEIVDAKTQKVVYHSSALDGVFMDAGESDVLRFVENVSGSLETGTDYVLNVYYSDGESNEVLGNSVAFHTTIFTGVDEVDVDEVQMSVNGRKIAVSGAVGAVRVYNVSGVCVAQSSGESSVVLGVNQPGVYMVSVNGLTYKVALK